MSKGNKGPPLPKLPIRDRNEAIAILEWAHHWSATKENRQGNVLHRVRITHGGRRVSVSRITFVGAVAAAVEKWHAPAASPKFMRIAG